jgi:hypothetical protein
MLLRSLGILGVGWETDVLEWTAAKVQSGCKRDDGTLSPWTLGGGGFRIAGPRWTLLERFRATSVKRQSGMNSSSRAEEGAAVSSEVEDCR